MIKSEMGTEVSRIFFYSQADFYHFTITIKLSATCGFSELGVIEGHSWSQTKDRDHRWAPVMPQAEYDHVYLWCAGLTAGNMFRGQIQSPWLGDKVDSGI
jgi:hypothetical protein